MSKPGKIRVITLGLIQDGDRLFVSEGLDRIQQDLFYRALGGGVDFGESSLEALHREFAEEIQAELTNVQYVGCLENRFIYEGSPGHEWIQLYRCDFADPKFYQLDSLMFQEHDGQPHRALWVPIEQFKQRDLRLVPEQCLDYL